MTEQKQCCLCGGVGHDSKDCGMRAEFDKWYAEHEKRSDFHLVAAKDSAWIGWQAARAQPAGEAVAWKPDFRAMHAAADEYLSGYEMIGEGPSGQDGYYTPTAADRALIQDFIAGLFCEDDFVAAISRTAPPAQVPAGEAVAWKLFKQALFVGMERNCVHYLMANAHGRRDGALKAHNHELLCRHIVAAVRGCDPDMVRRHHEDDYEAMHEGTQALTSYLDEVIGFPLHERPDYDGMVPKFFDKFFELAMAALGITAPQPTQQPAQVPDGWQLVPIKASPAMINAMREYIRYGWSDSENGSRPMSALYADMLAAAPQPKGDA